MNIEKIKISLIKTNPDNPRIIKDERFELLKNNIKKYPKFLEKRPIVIDSWKNPIILGGNMRYRALVELGYKEIPKAWVSESKDYTKDEKRAFIIIDNQEFGESDWDKLAKEWDETELREWGMEFPGMDAEQLGEGFSLKDGDKEPFQQITFTLADAQAERIKQALKECAVQEGTTYGNENSNGNALHQIVLEWVEQKKSVLA